MPTSLNKYLDPTSLDETVVNIRQIVEGLEAEMQNLPYARPDGLYPDMTVGSVIGADDTAQWATRDSTGSGAATVRSVQGAAVAWNQIVPDATAHKSGTATSSTWLQTGNFAMTSGHKYLLIRSGVYLSSYNTCRIVSTASPTVIYGLAPDTSSKQGIIFDCTDTRDTYFVQAWVTSDETYDFWLNVYDLTQMFGSGNEPTTVAEFEAMFPASYYPYSAPTLKPVTIAGFSSTDAQGGELDAIEWTAQTLWGAGTAGDVLYSDHKETRMGVVDLGTLTWTYSDSRFTSAIHVANPEIPLPAAYAANVVADIRCVPFTTTSRNDVMQGDGRISMHDSTNTVEYLNVTDSRYTTAADFKTAMNGVLLCYALATPTTTPISPALPMTYRVERGGSEAVIVPTGEISAAPVLTVAEPVNAGDEFARIWAAIESLGYTRNAAQLSRPVSLTDIGSIDEVQKGTADVVEKEAAEVAEIDTVKEVQE